ncbi:MAG: alpha/beta hydrolase [Deltaproteobacteria bacterium]|nr:alpha/beta hydrolase [Deltaproteobacteria bacterium]
MFVRIVFLPGRCRIDKKSLDPGPRSGHYLISRAGGGVLWEARGPAKTSYSSEGTMTMIRGEQGLSAKYFAGARKRMRVLAILMLACALTGCALFATAPMDVLTYKHQSDAAHEGLFVFLRGIGGSHCSFEEEGLVADVWARDLPFDMAAPNAHFGYYERGNLVSRLKEDVIDPARARGTRKIWLVGVSMGGLGALLYLKERPEDIAGVYLISPFLGTQYFLDEIKAAGGVNQWDPGPYNAMLDWQRMLWHWLKTDPAGCRDKVVYLGYGTEDVYKSASQLLAPMLPPSHVYAIAGAHDYQTFKTLWKVFLANDAELKN